MSENREKSTVVETDNKGKRKTKHPSNRRPNKKPVEGTESAIFSPDKKPVAKPETKRSDGKAQKSELRALILRTVEQKNGQLKKKDLFEVCLECFGLTAAEKKDRSPESKWTNSRSVTGLVISELVAEGKIKIDAEGFCRTPEETVKECDDDLLEKCEKLIETLLSGGKKLTKKEILAQCVEGISTAKPQSVKCEGGKALGALKENGKISQDKKSGVFYLEERFPNTPLGKTLRAAYEGADVKKSLIDALNLAGGPFFERFSVELLEKEFSLTGTVEKAEVTGGPDDGGIDGKIFFRDHLGFREVVLLQAKLRNVTKSETKYETGKQITLKEVREFFGAAVAAKGTRFIWITTTTFCREAKYFIEKQPDFVGINKDKLYELAKKHGIGVVTGADGKEELDYKKFIG